MEVAGQSEDLIMKGWPHRSPKLYSATPTTQATLLDSGVTEGYPLMNLSTLLSPDGKLHGKSTDYKVTDSHLNILPLLSVPSTQLYSHLIWAPNPSP